MREDPAIVQTTDPVALAPHAVALRSVVVSLRALTEDATVAQSKRVHARTYLRDNMLKKIREFEVRIESAAPPAP